MRGSKVQTKHRSITVVPVVMVNGCRHTIRGTQEEVETLVQAKTKADECISDVHGRRVRAAYITSFYPSCAYDEDVLMTS